MEGKPGSRFFPHAIPFVSTPLLLDSLVDFFMLLFVLGFEVSWLCAHFLPFSFSFLFWSQHQHTTHLGFGDRSVLIFVHQPWWSVHKKKMRPASQTGIVRVAGLLFFSIFRVIHRSFLFFSFRERVHILQGVNSRERRSREDGGTAELYGGRCLDSIDGLLFFFSLPRLCSRQDSSAKERDTEPLA